MPLSKQQLDFILSGIYQIQTTPAEFIVSLLRSEEHTDYNAVADIARRADEILESLRENEQARAKTLDWASKMTTKTYAEQIRALVQKNAGLQFSAHDTTSERLATFNIQELAVRMQNLAPALWDLLDSLLAADQSLNARRNARQEERAAKATPRKGRAQADGDIAMREPDEAHSDAHDEVHEQGAEDAAERRKGLVTIKKVVCLSVMAQSSNQLCNALQSVVGIFLHCCNTPETVVEFLAHIGLSISATTINNAITNLSKESITEMQRLGRTLLTAYAYDNLDIDLKHSIPTAEKAQDTLIHLTTGLMLPLHGTSRDDLRCSEQLWAKSKYNMSAKKEDIARQAGIDELLDLHPDVANHPSGLTRHERFNAWVFLRDLIRNGPEYFRKFGKDLQEPETVEQIPIEKSRQVPVQTMDISPSTPAANADALADLFRQGGVGDPGESGSVTDLGDHVVLVHGDLLTGERIHSLQASRSAERTPWRRYQFVIYVLGLFHLKMACADAVWRTFIQPKPSQLDDNSLMKHLAQIRPNETLKIGSKPGFRRMHEVIQHVGIVGRLDCWRLEVEKRRNLASLEEFAESKPSWEDLQEMASRMCLEYVAGATDIEELRRKNSTQRDAQRENSILRHQHFLLYEEMSHALNAGDIGRVEACFMPWVFIFKGCGKHKYAAHMMKYLSDVHFVYPEGLKKAVRMNILCNPTGKKGKFRGVDWWVEHNNLFTKRIYGGKFSNHQKARIIKESPLIEVYKNTRIQFENMFCLDHRTIAHSSPDMTRTFAILANYMRTNKANVHVPGRRSVHTIPDVMGRGINALMTTSALNEAGEWEDTAEDGEQEVEDGGDLAD